MPHYGAHALRHTFATKLLSKTSSHQDIKAVAELHLMKGFYSILNGLKGLRKKKWVTKSPEKSGF